MEPKIVGIDKTASIADDLVFILETKDSNGCLKKPYKINQVTIYFISRDFNNNYVNEYDQKIYDKDLQKEYNEAKQLACDFPTQENIDNLNYIKLKLDGSVSSSPFFFKEAMPVKIFGGYSEGVLYPAWLDPDSVPPSEKEKVEQDNILKPLVQNNTEVEGKFILQWSPLGQREGDYFICWNWQPNLSGDSLSAHFMFGLLGNSKLNTAIPTHYTNPEKYKILMERYLPEMFKSMLSDSDLSPKVLQELNLSVAKGFTFLEDFVNQTIDLLDANVLQEQFLPLLSNLFNLNLKSNDSVLWRRQIKKAIPNYKKKGTIGGLKTALADAGVELLKLTKLWQVISKYTYQESFVVSDYTNKFKLSKAVILPINPTHFELWLRINGSEDWQQLNSNYIDISTDSSSFYMDWIGQSLSIDPIELELGDEVKILYQFREIPSLQEENLESYIRSLDLIDQRDLLRPQYPQDNWNQPLYPPKNWNTKCLEEDDPLFDLLIPVRHPLKDPVIWGKVRTEFPYSENVYNMEEYNGSRRDSYNPCDIDKEFIDPCVDCQGSKFSIDIEVEELSNDRILESQKAIEEYVPFHAIIHSINFIGSVNEFMKPPIEEAIALLTYSGEDILISGEAQNIFNRAIPQNILPGDLSSPNLAYPLNLVRRNLLASMNDRTGTVSGTGKNLSILLFAPGSSQNYDLNNFSFYDKNSSFDKRNINETFVSGSPLDNSNLLEILSPSSNAGYYSVANTKKNSFEIVAGTVNESPLDESQFEFRISNKIYEQSSVDITQDNLYIFSPNKDLSTYQIVTQKDVDDNISIGPVWKIKINDVGYTYYDILEILPNNTFELKGPIPDFNINNVSWELLDPSLATQESGYAGDLNFYYRALANFNPSSFGSPVDDIRNYSKIGDYLFYNNDQYEIKSYLNGENYKFYIKDYSLGDIGGISVKIYRRIVENCVGQLGYSGLILETTANYETFLPIQNGVNSLTIKTLESEFKENYLIFIDSDYYSISQIDGLTITLNGPAKNWTTSGTSVNFVIYQFINQPLSLPERVSPELPGHNFSQVIRSNNEIIEGEIEMITPLFMKILNSKESDDNVLDHTTQSEGISVSIEYKDGNKEEKNI